EVTPCVLSARGAGANRRPHGGGIAQEANAPGKARGYADVGTVVWRVEPTDGVQALPGNDGWDRLPWFILGQELSRPQTRTSRASGAVTIRQRRGHHDVVWMTATRPLRSRMRGNAHVRLCVQERLVCSAGVSPAGVRIGSPVAGRAGRRVTDGPGAPRR